MKCIFSVDVEDWFHILDVPSTPTLYEWDKLPSHLEKNFFSLLDMLAQRKAHATCFFLGWVANRFPHLVKAAVAGGHEVGSHGYAHRLVYQMTRDDFYADALTSKQILENIAGCQVLGYRAPGFSVTERTPWFFDMLREAGYRYDSSVFPASGEHGNMRGKGHWSFFIDGASGMIEFPMTVTSVFGRPVCFFGGGYLRLFPYFVVRKMTSKVLCEKRPVVFYVHPREVDPDHPRLRMNLRRRFKCYVNLKTTARKVGNVLDEFEVTSFREFILDYSAWLAEMCIQSPGRAHSPDTFTRDGSLVHVPIPVVLEDRHD